MGSGLATTPAHRVAGHRVLGPGRARGKLFALLGITSDRQLDEPMTLLGNRPDQRFVDASDGMLLELATKMSVCLIGLGNDHHAGGILIQSMNETRPFLSADRGHRAA